MKTPSDLGLTLLGAYYEAIDVPVGEVVFAGGRLRTTREVRGMASYSALDAVERSTGGATAGQVQRATGLDEAALTQALSDLVESGAAVKVGDTYIPTSRGEP